MITKIDEARIAVVDFLGADLINHSYFFMDYWTFVHFSSAILLMLFISKIFKKWDFYKKIILFLLVIDLWEIFELHFPLMGAEKTIDIVYDFIIAIAGGSLTHYAGKRVF
ncbi:MAG TPA: hypothetical protein VJ208_01120 [Candidatus Nanoarchaeia archaeon]|nr:hypothetical protein [Candidatus Nanoarchaeia archaeon]